MSLKDEIAAVIERDGPISFATYMELALYHPAHGFFTGAPVGDEGDFVTSVHVSPVFPALLAEQIREAWTALGSPSTFALVDAGAADGRLLSALREELSDIPLRPIAVERSKAARRLAASRGLETVAAMEQLGFFTGCVIANELLDNLPFRRMRIRDGRPVEIFVGIAQDRLVEVERELWDPKPRRFEEWTEPTVALAFVDEVAERLQRGYCFVLDYGFTDGERPEPVRAYRGHRRVVDVLSEPGQHDITGPVDFTAVVDRARAAGLQTWGPVSQRRALFSLGYARSLASIRQQQAILEAGGKWRAAVELFEARTRAAMLVDPAGLGSHKVLALATPGLPEPMAVRQK